MTATITTARVAVRAELPVERARPLSAAPAPRSAPAPRRRADLRVVEAPRPRTRRARRTVVLAAAVTVLALLTVVAFHVLLAQSQIALDHIGRRTAAAERRYAEARLEHARLSGPARIVAEAARLGLVPPAQPPTAVPVEGATPVPPRGTATTLDGWTEVKPTLGDRP